MKSGAYLAQTLTDPKTAFSEEPNETTIQRAFNFTGSRWDFLERPENVIIARRYASAMNGMSRMQPPEAVVSSACKLSPVRIILMNAVHYFRL